MARRKGIQNEDTWCETSRTLDVKIIYTIKIAMFQDQLKCDISESLLTKNVVLARFLCLYFVKPWSRASLPFQAPIEDLILYKTIITNICVARIFDWGGGGGVPKPQMTCSNVIWSFQKNNFLWVKDIVEWKIWSRSLLALNQDFGKGRWRKIILRKCKCLT